MDFKNKLKGCLVYGAIGDAIGYKYEGSLSTQNVDLNFDWIISDDTQLTLATCEAIFNVEEINPEKVAGKFLEWYTHRKLNGLGASTLKALRELQMGGHWALVGRSGEFAAGNGAAMRIAPLAFKQNIARETIKDICTITHKNDEAYTGALTIYYSVLNAKNGNWSGDTNLIDTFIDELPDTNVKDRLLTLNRLNDLSIARVGQMYKTSGYVADSVPFSIFAAQKINQLSAAEIFTELIKTGGDTDTICSMTGQIIGTLLGCDTLPPDWITKYDGIGIKPLVDSLVENWKE
ncbi:MAG: ADP-ribosylglycohydrolase family protein [Sediminibacterium sp.]|nr:ADP-ribosylglycohydrolase family protein [Sediminibacterium sp.]